MFAYQQKKLSRLKIHRRLFTRLLFKAEWLSVLTIYKCLYICVYEIIYKCLYICVY